jgi:hypothetical protein
VSESWPSRIGRLPSRFRSTSPTAIKSIPTGLSAHDPGQGVDVLECHAVRPPAVGGWRKWNCWRVGRLTAKCHNWHRALVGRSDVAPPPPVRVTTFQSLRRQVEDRGAPCPAINCGVRADGERGACGSTRTVPPDHRTCLAAERPRRTHRCSGLRIYAALGDSTWRGSSCQALASAVSVAAERISERHNTTVATPRYFLGSPT